LEKVIAFPLRPRHNSGMLTLLLTQLGELHKYILKAHGIVGIAHVGVALAGVRTRGARVHVADGLDHCATGPQAHVHRISHPTAPTENAQYKL
jgi:hypothetical protein